MNPSVFPNLRRTHEKRNLPFSSKQLSFLFPTFFLMLSKGNISMGTWERTKLGKLPLHNALEFFCWERSLKVDTQEIKWELCTSSFLQLQVG